MAFTVARIRQVMREKHCDYSTACSWLGKRAAEARAGRKRARERKRELIARERRLMEAMGID